MLTCFYYGTCPPLLFRLRHDMYLKLEKNDSARASGTLLHIWSALEKFIKIENTHFEFKFQIKHEKKLQFSILFILQYAILHYRRHKKICLIYAFTLEMIELNVNNTFLVFCFFLREEMYFPCIPFLPDDSWNIINA